jgi:hypothetical protein
MPIIRFDVQSKSGVYEQRYWAITNTPVLGPDGFVACRAQDVTDLVMATPKSLAERAGNTLNTSLTIP